jgi:hypothetical protein
MRFYFKIILPVFSVLLIFSCGGKPEGPGGIEHKDDTVKSKAVSIDTFYIDSSEVGGDNKKYVSFKERYLQVITLLKQKKFNSLSEMIHPEKGLRFSPYAFVSKKDPVFMFMDSAGFAGGTEKYSWGNYDGSGMPIKLSLSEYFKKFIFDKDYSNAPVVKENEFTGSGNTKNNTREFYPKAETVDFHFPGTEKSNNMDWSTLRLVFEKEGNNYFLVGIIHDQWTI